MHALLLTLTLVTRALPGQAFHDRPAYQPLALVATAPAAMVATQQQPPPTPPQPPQINVEVNRGGRGWYANPVWVAIGGLALVVVILLIVVAARGGNGGTTVVRG